MLIDRTTVALWEYQGRNITSFGWNRFAIEDAVAKVNRGAALLDNAKPGWPDEVLPGKLDMGDPNFCMIGQTYGDYDAVGLAFGLDALAVESEDYDIDVYDEKAIAHGFLTDSSFDHETKEDFVPYELLDRVWVYMLTVRKETERPVMLELPEQEPINVQLQRLIDDDILGRVAETTVEAQVEMTRLATVK